MNAVYSDDEWRKLVIWRRAKYREWLWQDHLRKARLNHRDPFRDLDSTEAAIMRRVDARFPLVRPD